MTAHVSKFSFFARKCTGDSVMFGEWHRENATMEIFRKFSDTYGFYLTFGRPRLKLLRRHYFPDNFHNKVAPLFGTIQIIID